MDNISEMGAQASDAARLLKALSHEERLMILCHLVSGELCVGELEALLDRRQATVSQHLARLRTDGLVETRRAGKTIYYRLVDGPAKDILSVLHAAYCS